MANALLSALLALTSSPEAALPSQPASLDQRCFQMMSQLAEEEDPRIRSAAITGAQYFLGRIDANRSDANAEDASIPGFSDPAGAAEPSTDLGDREALMRQCAEVMGAGGRDFRAIGARLVRTAPSV